MTSINDQGAIFIKAREFINFIRSTILYNDKINELKEELIGLKGDPRDIILVFDFTIQELVIINKLKLGLGHVILANGDYINGETTVTEKVY